MPATNATVMPLNACYECDRDAFKYLLRTYREVPGFEAFTITRDPGNSLRPFLTR
jgi:hypothetical protein